MRKIALLGSTGSIGRNTIEVLKSLNKNGYPLSIVFLSSFSNSKLLIEQIKSLKPAFSCIIDETSYNFVDKNCDQENCKLLKGLDGILEFIKL